LREGLGRKHHLQGETVLYHLLGGREEGGLPPFTEERKGLLIPLPYGREGGACDWGWREGERPSDNIYGKGRDRLPALLYVHDRMYSSGEIWPP